MSTEDYENIPAQLINVDRREDDDVEDDDPIRTAYKVADHVMTKFAPGFVIIGSPHLQVVGEGYGYPDAVGIVINDRVGMSKLDVAAVLVNIARELNADMDRVENFVREALGTNE
jgi:hypothetical protein